MVHLSAPFLAHSLTLGALWNLPEAQISPTAGSELWVGHSVWELALT